MRRKYKSNFKKFPTNVQDGLNKIIEEQGLKGITFQISDGVTGWYNSEGRRVSTPVGWITYGMYPETESKTPFTVSIYGSGGWLQRSFTMQDYHDEVWVIWASNIWETVMTDIREGPKDVE